MPVLAGTRSLAGRHNKKKDGAHEAPQPPRANRSNSILLAEDPHADMTIRCLNLQREVLKELGKFEKTRFIVDIVETMKKQAEVKEPPSAEEMQANIVAEMKAALFPDTTGVKALANSLLIAPSQRILQNAWFNGTIIACIVIAGANVGVQSYPDMEDNTVLKVADDIILALFTLEVIFKILEQGRYPYKYFTNQDKEWNIFDFTIVGIAYVFMVAGGSGSSVSFLRLLRLLRLLKLLNKIKQLNIIVHGLATGLQHCVYIFVLMMIVFYMFAVIAVIFFGDNDPAHFGNIAVAMLTLFRCSTLEDWTDVMYINMYGCDEYDSGLYSPANVSSLIYTQFGTFQGYDCYRPKAQPIIAAVYFGLFVLVSAFVMLSLFVGAVCNGMNAAVEDMAAEDEKMSRERRDEKQQMFQRKALENPKLRSDEPDSADSANGPGGDSMLKPTSSLNNLLDAGKSVGRGLSRRMSKLGGVSSATVSPTNPEELSESP
eukprot:CAMPEP_0182582422 /NCGR_PEP_ID=MMETSP1324-20130603/52503_1 /TAXON_ID=236786 /ORGANISM="Florenciella sp., Strain RCC1587" /LENGTH=486 /DNA_ID=CAMNT_0024798879 /DNA_START=122 /DNA_END=1578 /DNA_ORIENTATION=-